MAVIDLWVFSGVADRVAKQAEHVKSGLDLAYGGDLKYYERVTSTDDYDVEYDLITPAEDLDNDFSHTTILSTIFRDLVNALETHVTGESYDDLDAYLTDKDIDVSWHFDDAYNATKGNHLNAINVFGDVVPNLGEWEATGSGTGTFTDGSIVGTGTGKTSSTNRCETLLEAYCVTAIGGTNLILDITLTDDDGTAASEAVTVPSGSALGTTVDIGGTSRYYVDVTNIRAAGGTSGDKIRIRSKIKRTVIL